MLRLTPLVTVAIAMAISSPSFAQSPEAVSPPRYGVRASQEHAPRGSLLVAFAENNPSRWITEFWTVSPGWMAPGAKPVVFARRALDAWNGQEQREWADSRACSGLIEALLGANDLPLPGVMMPLDEASRLWAREIGFGAPLVPDGPGPSVFWAPGRGQAGMEVQFSAYRGPWVDWRNHVVSILRSCWQSEQPPYPDTN
jgi:hypothetical protein